MSRYLILVDLDGTVAHSGWREGYKADGWDAFHAQGEHDLPAEDVLALLRPLREQFSLVGLTGRPEKFRQMTTRWCIINDVPLDEILMRPHDCYLPSPECKLLCMQERYGERWPSLVLCLIDDRDDVTAAFAAKGISTLCITPRKP